MNGDVGGGISQACCLISLLESNPLSPRRSQLTRYGSPARYLLFTLGYRSWSRLVMAKREIIWSIETPLRRWDAPRTQDMKSMLLSPTPISRRVRSEIARRIFFLEEGLR